MKRQETLCWADCTVHETEIFAGKRSSAQQRRRRVGACRVYRAPLPHLSKALTGLKNGHFWQKCLFLDHKKWHFECPNQNSKTTFIVQTFAKYGPEDFYFMNLSLLGAILAKFQFW